MASMQIAYLQEENFQIFEGLVTQDPEKRIPWRDLPKHRGWDVSMLHAAGEDDSHYIKAATAFMQEWLIFGLLGSVAGIFKLKVQVNDFLSKGGHGKFLIDLRRLQAFFSELCRAHGSTSHETWDKHQFYKVDRPESEAGVYPTCYDQHNSQLLHILEDVYLVLLKFHGNRYLDMEIAIFSEITASTLDYINYVLHAGYPERTWNLYAHTLVPSMRQHGWCYYQLNILCEATNTATIQYLSQNQRAGTTERNHFHCQQNHCFENDLDLEKYETKHVESSCSCPVQSPDMTKVNSLLLQSNDCFPLISIPRAQLEDKDHKGLYDLEVISSTTKTPYIAISHVWSDGLGNERANTLPLCQIRRIGLYALQCSYLPYISLRRKGESDVTYDNTSAICFWIDTFCVPRNNELAKKNSIRRMSNTFHEAFSVAIIDSTFTSLNYKDDCLLAHIAVIRGRWVRRLWTYNEGKLARDQLLIFADGPRRLHHWHSPPPLNHLPMTENLCMFTAGKVMFEFCPSLGAEEPERGVDSSVLASIARDLAFLSIMSGIRWKSTSKKSDEAICLAQIFRIDPKNVLNAHGDERMRVFLLEMKTFHKNIIFAEGPRLKIQGFRWALKSLMNLNLQDWEKLNDGNGNNFTLGKVTQHGFYVASSGLTFCKSQESLEETFCVWVEEKQMEYTFKAMINEESVWEEVRGNLAILVYTPARQSHQEEDLQPKELQIGDSAVLLWKCSAPAAVSAEEMIHVGPINRWGRKEIITDVISGEYLCGLVCVQSSFCSSRRDSSVIEVENHLGYLPAPQIWKIS